MIHSRMSRPLNILLLACVMSYTANARAALDATTYTNDLNQLLVQGGQLQASMTAIVLNPWTMASQTAALTTQADAFVSDVIVVYNTTLDTGGSLSLTTDMLAALEQLSVTAASLAQQSMRLSGEMANLAAVTATTVLDASLTSMLRLSDDIGVMADRIGEMADRILVMADNIGAMADRILTTQLIQSANLGQVVDAMLLTQQNLITLASHYGL